MGDALFVRDGETYLPTELARGPWAPDALHGGPVAGLLARLDEDGDRPAPMHPVRMTLELLRPVRLAPLRGRVRVLRPGRKVWLAESALFDGDTEVARATLLWVRSAALPVPATHGGGRAEPPPGPDGVATTPPAWRGGPAAFHSHATEHRVVRGAWGRPGPCTDWIRLREPGPDALPPASSPRRVGVPGRGHLARGPGRGPRRERGLRRGRAPRPRAPGPAAGAPLLAGCSPSRRPPTSWFG